MKWRDVRRSYTDRIDVLQERLERCPYLVLGLSETATDEEVKQAYRSYVSAYHPDKQVEFVRAHSQEVMKVVNIAYDRIRLMRNL